MPPTSTPQLAQSTAPPSQLIHAYGYPPSSYGASPQNPQYIQAAPSTGPTPFDFHARSNESHSHPTTHRWGPGVHPAAAPYHVASHGHGQDIHPPATSSYTTMQMVSSIPPPQPIISSGYPAMDGYSPSQWPATQRPSTYTPPRYV